FKRPASRVGHQSQDREGTRPRDTADAARPSRRGDRVSYVPKAVLEAADVTAVCQLILRERVSRDLAWWEQMRDCFHDDSVVRISWINASGPEFVQRSKEMAERNVQASHRLGPIFVTLAGDRAIAQLVAIIDIPFKLEGIEVMLSSHTRLLL